MKKILRSKIITVLLCAFMLTLFLAGCTQNEPSDNNQSSAYQVDKYDYTNYTEYTDHGLGITLNLPSKYFDNEAPCLQITN